MSKSETIRIEVDNKDCKILIVINERYVMEDMKQLLEFIFSHIHTLLE